MLKLDHVALRVSDMDAAIAFYTEKIGLELMYDRTDEEHHERFAFLKLEGGNLELLQNLDANNQPVAFPKPNVEEPYCPHVAIATKDLSALAMSLEKRGIPLLKGPMEIPASVRWLYVADPDNNILEFVQWLEA